VPHCWPPPARDVTTLPPARCQTAPDRPWRCVAVALFSAAAISIGPAAAIAQSASSPGWQASPRVGEPAAVPAPVERDDLAPVMAGDGSGLPLELWGGLDLAGVEKLIGQLTLPPRSPVLHSLWKRLMLANSATGTGAGANFNALRLEALYRSGLVAEADAAALESTTPLLMLLAARSALAAGDKDDACRRLRGAGNLQGEIPASLKGQAILMTGYCAAIGGNASAAGLAAEIAREEGVPRSPGLDALDAIASGSNARFAPSASITLIDQRLAAMAGGLAAQDVIDKGEPALLTALANDSDTPADLGLPASEAAARLHAVNPGELAAIYRANGRSGASLADSAGDDPLLRASLFKSAEAEGDPRRKAQLMQAFIDAMRRHGLAFHAMTMLAPALQTLTPSPELGWFSATAAETAIVAGNYASARTWSDLPNTGLAHWAALADIADPANGNRGARLADLERMALSGGFSADTLHRLATVLDALLYQVPIPLWDAASQTPQPNDGYLPPTGVLSELQDAARKQEFGRTVLLVMQSLGPDGPERAHMITLGDSIRALKRAGLETEARRVAVEALLGTWPRDGQLRRQRSERN
jgi:hypothetical protein